jgi:hypothetical protein
VRRSLPQFTVRPKWQVLWQEAFLTGVFRIEILAYFPVESPSLVVELAVPSEGQEAGKG